MKGSKLCLLLDRTLCVCMLSDGINVVDVKGDVWKSCGRVCGLGLNMESVSQIRWGGAGDLLIGYMNTSEIVRNC